ncbi:hypothetical protein ACFL4U_00500 [Candidatus Neomarinimicrobiota bacterium]
MPDVSLVGDITAKVSDDRSDFYRNKILIRGIEFALQGYLYPEMRADAFFAFHRHGDHFEAEICEGYASFLNLLGEFSLIAGKKHVDFGKINKLHQHHVPYVDRPIVLTNFFGEHGLVGEGASLDYLLPLPFFLQLTIGGWSTENGTHDEEHPEEEVHFTIADRVYTSRAWASFSLGDYSELEIGGSGAIGQGPHHDEHKDEVRVVGFDLTFKYWPSAYRRLLLQGEALQLMRELPDERITRWGLYGFLGYRFTKYWDAGFRYDWAENALPEKELTQKLSACITNHLTETTKVRFQYGYCLSSNIYEAVIQLIFGIGPHSHPLE